jgi:hypothetical protein
MKCCNNEIKELLPHNNCGCDENTNDNTCDPLFDIASPLDGQTLEFSSETNTFVNKFATKDGISSGLNAAQLGNNCPAIDPTTPYTWLAFLLKDGTTVYVPAWK